MMYAIVSASILLSLVLAQTTPDATAQLKNTFDQLDANNDHGLSVHEFLDFYDKFDLNEKGETGVFRRHDVQVIEVTTKIRRHAVSQKEDGKPSTYLTEYNLVSVFGFYLRDGHMSLADYIAVANVTTVVATPLFNYYDIDKDGDLTHKDIRQLFKGYDENGDHKVTEGEFIHHSIELSKLLQSLSVGK